MIEADNAYKSVSEVQKAISNGKTTVKAVVEQYLKAIEELNPKLNAILALNGKAVEDAEKLDVSTNQVTRPQHFIGEAQWRCSQPIETLIDH